MELHIIYTETQVLLSKRAYASWTEIQDEYDTYKTSLGPWDEEDVIDFLAEEYTDIAPPARDQVGAFVSSNDVVSEVTFVARA